MQKHSVITLCGVSLLSGCAKPTSTEPPAATTQRPVTVDVTCIIEPTGLPNHCRVISNDGPPSYAASVIAWLTGPNPPRYQPAVKSGQPAAETHTWAITFKPQPN